MSRPFLAIGRIERRLSTGATEDLRFTSGVNVLVGRPNTGKTKWLQTLDYVLGSPSENPFEGADEEGLSQKYDKAGAELVIGEERIWIERRWRELGAKGKVFVDSEGMTAREFQHFLMEKLGIPPLNFPKGNPMSGQTWPELSFRMLLRHIYRQQRFWNDVTDQQPEGEQHACVLQILGLAERLYTEDYGRLVKLKMDVDRMKARREQYAQTLDELARDLLSSPGLTVGANATTVRDAVGSIARDIENLRQRRTTLIAGTRDKVFSPERRTIVEQLGDARAKGVANLENLKRKAMETTERLKTIRRYHTDLADEIDRMTRAEDAGAVLADLKITHCPACDQPLTTTAASPEHCFLCHQTLPDEVMFEELGAVRLRFERDRLTSELKEIEELESVLQRETKRLADEMALIEEQIRMLENELVPARQSIAVLIQPEVSAIDMELGKLNEKQRQLGRVAAAVELGQQLTTQIAAIENEIKPLQAQIDELTRATDFDAAAAQLEDGMNAYLNAINILRPGVWRHSPIVVDLSRSNFTIRLGARRWQAALGGTDSLYFLMAYQYGLMTVSHHTRGHYPGLSIIDLPAEFSGELVEDKENFIVQPFIELLATDTYEGAQLIITGASFAGLLGAHRLHLTHVYVA